MGLKRISDWLTMYGVPIGSAFVFIGALLAGVQYIVKSEVTDLRVDIGSVKSDITDLKSASSKTDRRFA